MLDLTPSASNGYDAAPQAISGQGSGGMTCESASVAGYDLRTVDQHLQRIEADFAAYRRETDVKIAVQHTELVSLHTEFRKLFDAVQHIGEPGFTMPEGNFHINE